MMKAHRNPGRQAFSASAISCYVGFKLKRSVNIDLVKENEVSVKRVGLSFMRKQKHRQHCDLRELFLPGGNIGPKCEVISKLCKNFEEENNKFCHITGA